MRFKAARWRSASREKKIVQVIVKCKDFGGVLQGTAQERLFVPGQARQALNRLIAASAD
jgi:hypothetical protein